MRARFARHLRGRGLEIGALRNPLPVPNAAEVLYSDLLTAEQLAALYPGSRPPDILSDSESFPTIESNSLDFVIANHVIEHLTDPIRALREWHRILREGGLLYLAVPDKRFTFDHKRRRTTREHLLEDHASQLPPHERNRAHLLDWAEHVEGLAPGSEAFERWVGEQLGGDYAVHNHVWVAQDILDLLRHLDDVPFALVRWKNASPLRNEFLLLLRKCRTQKPLAFTIAIGIARLQHPLLELAGALRRALRKT